MMFVEMLNEKGGGNYLKSIGKMIAMVVSCKKY